MIFLLTPVLGKTNCYCLLVLKNDAPHLPGPPARDFLPQKSGDSNSGSESGASLEGVVMHGNNLPELLLGLSYNGTTGRLAVEVIRGSTFALPTLSRPPGERSNWRKTASDFSKNKQKILFLFFCCMYFVN